MKIILSGCKNLRFLSGQAYSGLSICGYHNVIFDTVCLPFPAARNPAQRRIVNRRGLRQRFPRRGADADLIPLTRIPQTLSKSQPTTAP